MDHNTLLNGLRQRYRAVADPLLPQGSTCAIVDFPNHTNVGDLAIWAGMKAYLRERDIHVAYQCDTFTYDAPTLRKIIGDTGTILMHGGGNFGDLWENHERLREVVLQDFPNANIIQFPQSIYFEKVEHASHIRNLINERKNFTLLVRDEDSERFAIELLHANTYLCPDSAFMLGAMRRSNPPCKDIVWLARTDKEALNKPTEADDIEVVDWLGAPRDPRHLVCYGSARLSKIFRSMGLGMPARLTDFIASSLFDTVASIHIRRGIRMISRGKIVVTDRLHAHILCLLLDIPHIVLDNNYGKLSRFHGTWANFLPLSTWASSSDEALRIAREAVRQG